MKKLLLFILFSLSAFSQQYKITYIKSSNGKVIEHQVPILLLINTNKTIITNKENLEKSAKFPFETVLINRNKTNEIINIAQLSKNKSIATLDSISLNKQEFEFSSDTKQILGYTCNKAKTVINSNHIEIWYTNNLGIYGSPTTLAQNLGLVLEINRNGNFVIQAQKIEKIKSMPILDKNFNFLDNLTYKDLLWKSRFTTISIFDNETINFSDQSVSNDSILTFANGTIILRKIKFPKIKSASQLFLNLTTQSNGDAYDRTGSVFLIPDDKQQSFLTALQNNIKSIPAYTNGNGKEYRGVVATENYLPLLELMRFFTPFGINHYNYIELKDKKWHDKVFYRQDISDFGYTLNDKEFWIGVFIGNYDKGGHKVTANITIHNEDDLEGKNLNTIPVFNTTNILEMAGQEYATMFNVEKGLDVVFTLEHPLKNTKLRYITTGHGGWENGDEFVPKLNTILLNENIVFEFTPWRTDCGSYRLYNPASGNFLNGLSSSDYSRSNWCPGTTTNPVYINLGDLPSGTHKLQIKIPQGKPEGNSFSAWNVSGVMLGEK